MACVLPLTAPACCDDLRIWLARGLAWPDEVLRATPAAREAEAGGKEGVNDGS